MSQSQFTFNVQPYIPNRFVWAFTASLIAFYALVSSIIVLLVISLLLILICITTRYMVAINIEEKWFNEYVWFLGFKNGKPVKYQSIDYAFIVRNKVTQSTSSRVQTTSVSKDEFRGFVKFDGEEKIHIITKYDHGTIINEMKSVASGFKTALIDNSSGHPVQIQ